MPKLLASFATEITSALFLKRSTTVAGATRIIVAFRSAKVADCRCFRWAKMSEAVVERPASNGIRI